MPFCAARVSCLILLAAVTLQGAEPVPAVTVSRLEPGGIQPQVVRDRMGAVHLLTFRGEPATGDIWYSVRRAGERDFTPAIQVNSQPGSSIAVGSIRGPQLAVGRAGRVHVVWNGSSKAEPRGKGKFDSPLLYARLRDDASQFEPERDLIGSAYILDGGSSVAADDAGTVCVLWHAGQNGDESRRVWLARSQDDGTTFTRETAIDVLKIGACGCCGLKAGADDQGTIYVLYRAAREGRNRDLHLLGSRDGGVSFASRQLGRWNTTVCPMSSAAFAESGRQVAVAWETQGQIQFARIDKETGEVGLAASAPGPGRARRLPAVALNGEGQLLLVWTEGTGWEKGGDLAWQLFDMHDRALGKMARGKNVPVWSFAAAWAERDGSFGILY